MTRKKKVKLVFYNLWIERKSLDGLKALSITEERSVSWLIRRAVKLFLEQPGGTMYVKRKYRKT